MRVRDCMTANPVTVTPATSVLNARRLLRTCEVRHLPVVEEEGRVVGIVSDGDLVPGDRVVAASLSALASDLVDGRYRPVGTVMSTPVHSAQPDDSVETAVRLMLAWRVNALPVVTDGVIAGIITTTDCLEALLDELERPETGEPSPADDPDLYVVVPLGPGDERPGRRDESESVPV